MMIILCFFTFQSGDFYNQESSFAWGTLISALIASFTVVIGYSIQKSNERKAKNRETCKIAYLKFIDEFTEGAVNIMHDKKTDAIEDDRKRMLARNQLLLYANDKVIKAYHNWIEYSDKKNSDLDQEVLLFGKILLEIRKDIHGGSQVTEEEISNLNPFNRG